MKKHVVVIAFIVLLSACADDEVVQNDARRADGQQTSSINDISVRNGRLVFPNSNLFYETLQSIQKMDHQELQSWRGKYAISSLEAYLNAEGNNSETEERDDLRQLPVILQMVLNSNAEVQIGDEIVWYNKGVIHFASNDDVLEKLKGDPSTSKKTGKYFRNIAMVDPAENGAVNGRIYMNYNGRTSHQKETTSCVSGNPRKHVFELVGYIEENPIHEPVPPPFEEPEIIGHTFYSLLYIDVKLEFKSSGTWYSSSDYRFIEYDLRSDVKLVSDGRVFRATKSFATGNRPIETNASYQLYLYDHMRVDEWYSHTPYYDVQVNGWLYQAQSTLQLSPGGGHCNAFAKGGVSGVVW